MSDPRAANLPETSRWARCRSWRGFIKGRVAEVKIGTPIKTMRPSLTEVESKMMLTTSQEASAPMNRGMTSKAPPIRIASIETVPTMSPGWISLVTAVPAVERCRPTNWIDRYVAVNQFVTANWWRMAPLTA
ncbi:unannotated protein [freshwater metagenome]|uniref:Unannotated protein n=1 Tax=freshwater metagenome TaxID=449393 RepID=A0A6J6WV45_9ZZZZ